MTDIPETKHYAHFINGANTKGSSSVQIKRYCPALPDVLCSTYCEGTEEDALEAIEVARRAFDFGGWRHVVASERARILQRTAALIRENRDELGLIECLESGKPLAQARDEMDWASGIWDYAAALARTLHGDTSNHLGEGMFGMTLQEPVGVCAMITPWNFPLLIMSQKLPFALAAGCTAVIKPSEFTSGTTLRLAELLKEAGLPDGVCNVVTGYGDVVGQTLCESEQVDLVSFTGSTSVGKRIAEMSAGNLKKVALELGGKNPQLIFSDCDIDAVIDAIIHGVFFNMGECCNSGSRILVDDSIADEIVSRVIEATQTISTGDILDPETKIGAIINEAQHNKILEGIAQARQAGADIALGGEVLNENEGLFITPTIIDRVTADMAVAKAEIFGPVLSVLRFKGEAEAVALANDVDYGLSASVWTRDFDRAMRLTRELNAGTVWINTFMDGSPELPFGGYKQSGVGRELGPDAVREYTETKTVTMRLGDYQKKWL